MLGDIYTQLKYLESARRPYFAFSIGDTVLTDSELISFTISATMGDRYTIGNFTVRELQMDLLAASAPSVLVGEKITIWIYIQGGDEIKLGTFIIEPNGIEINRQVMTIKAYDALGKLGKGALSLNTDYTQTTLANACQLLCNYMGNSLSAHGQTIINRANTYFHLDIPKGGNTIQRTMRDIATCVGCTAIIDVDGNLDFKERLRSETITLNAGDYINFSAQNTDVFTIGGITYTHPAENSDDPPLVYYSAGSTTGNVIALEWDESNWFDESNDNQLQWLYNVLELPLSYQCYKLDTIGLPFIELGDTIHLIDIDNNVYDLPVFKYTHSFNQGITSSFEAVMPNPQ